jgi:hypothetical protein
MGNQGSALLILAERTGDPEVALAAMRGLGEGAAVLREGGHVPWAEVFEHLVPCAKALVARLAAGGSGVNGNY